MADTPVTPTPITAWPTAPQRTDAPATFVTRADAWVAATASRTTQMNSLATNVNFNATSAFDSAAEAVASASAASTSATNAAASATAAESTANATAWISGEAITINDNRISQIDFLTYRANKNISSGDNTVDPASDPTDWVVLAAPSNQITATASGALSNGDMVIVNSDGTVSVVAGNASSAGTPVVFESASTTNIKAVYDTTNNRVVVAYVDAGNSEHGTAIVGTVSGTSISFGTAVVFEAAAVAQVSISYDATNDRVVIAYQDHGNSFYGTAIVGTVSGTSISFGTAVVFEAGTTTVTSIAYDSTNSKVVIAYRDGDNFGYGTAIVGTVSGTSISFGTAVVFEAANTTQTAITYDSTNQKIVIAYQDAGNLNYGTAIVGTVSGTSISFGTAVVFEAALAASIAITYDSTNSKVVIAYSDTGDSDYGKCVVGTVSGTSISFGTAVVFEAASTNNIGVTFNTTDGRIVISYLDAGNSNYGTAIVGTVSGTSISFGTAVVFESATSSLNFPVYDSTNQKIVIAYQDGGNSSYGTSLVFTSEITNLTSGNFIGVSDGAYSDAATATIQTSGAIDDAQSSLTTGQKYYVQTDGTLSTTAGTPSVEAGTAISATELIVKG